MSRKRSAAPSWPVTGMRKNILDAFGQRNGIIGSWPQGSENLVEQHLHLPGFSMGTKMTRLKHGNEKSPSLAKSWMIMNHQGFHKMSISFHHVPSPITKIVQVFHGKAMYSLRASAAEAPWFPSAKCPRLWLHHVNVLRPL